MQRAIKYLFAILFLATCWQACEKPVHESSTITSRKRSKLNMTLPEKQVQLTGDTIRTTFSSDNMYINDTQRRARIVFISYYTGNDFNLTLSFYKFGNSDITGTYYAGAGYFPQFSTYIDVGAISIQDPNTGIFYTPNYDSFSVLRIDSSVNGSIKGSFLLDVKHYSSVDTSYKIHGDFDIIVN